MRITMLMKSRAWLMTAMGALALMSLAACGGGDDDPSIGFIEGNWTSHMIATEIIEQVVRDQLSYLTHRVPLSITPGWAALCNEEVDIGAEAWLPSRLPEIQPFLDRECVVLGDTIFPGSIGWFVPRFVIEGDPGRGIEPMAPGLESVADLDDYWQVFENPERPDQGEVVGGEVGWIDHPQDISRIMGYDLNYYRSNQGEAVILARVKSAELQGQPILTYLWTPHSIFGEVDLVQLEEPHPYVERECFVEEEVPYQCAHPAFDVVTAMSTRLADIAPDVSNLVHHIFIGEQPMSEMMFDVDSQERPIPEVAAEWIQANQTQIDEWIADSNRG
ncbi:MAG: glycine betaine ABC transporter substrate-binding protein [Dehalococcoidia bacterium]